MKLSDPFYISSRLLAATRIGGAEIALGLTPMRTDDGRGTFECHITLADGTHHEITDLHSGFRGVGFTVRQGFINLLGFLGACADARSYFERTGNKSENHDLFNEAIGRWAEENNDEITMLEIDLEEDPTYGIDES